MSARARGDDLDRRTRRGQMSALDEYHFIAVAEGSAKVLQAGGNVGLGAHGEQQGICAHWELWAQQMGGLSNYDALRVATVMGADGLGFLDDLGTIEAGKLADLIVLDDNLFEMDPEAIHKIKPAAVMMEGKVIHGTLDGAD